MPEPACDISDHGWRVFFDVLDRIVNDECVNNETERKQLVIDAVAKYGCEETSLLNLARIGDLFKIPPSFPAKHPNKKGHE